MCKCFYVCEEYFQQNIECFVNLFKYMLLMSTPKGTDTPPPLHPRSRPHPSSSDQRVSSPAAPRDRPIAPRGPGPSATLGSQICVACCVVECGVGDRQFGVGCVSGVILCRYSCRIGDLFVRSCARSLLV